MAYEHTTIESAQDALAKAEADIAGDMGEEAVEAGWSDVVDIVAQDCSPEVRRELRRITGTEDRG